MAKTIIRETIIALLVCLAMLLILSVTLYNFIPSNKVVPEEVKYTPSKEIQTQLNSEVDKENKEVLMTYEVTASDLDSYQKAKEYVPGKANPFAAVSEETEDNNSGNSGNTGSNNNTGSSSQGGSNNNNQGGSLFENGSSK